MTVQFSKIGKWDKVADLLKNHDSHLRYAVMAGQKVVALRLQKIVKDHLVNQDLKWKPLSASYAAGKKDNQDMILVERWKYWDAIKIERTQNSYIIGVFKNRYYVNKDGSRIALYKVAALHESGSSKLFGRGIKLPARPLWGPSVRDLSALGINKIIVKEIRQYLERKGWQKTTLKELRKYKAPV